MWIAFWIIYLIVTIPLVWIAYDTYPEEYKQQLSLADIINILIVMVMVFTPIINIISIGSIIFSSTAYNIMCKWLHDIDNKYNSYIVWKK